jgi:hypothetical protein
MDSIIDSSVWMEPFPVRVLWISLFALKDKDFIVRKTAFQISKRANMSEQEVLDGLVVLGSPDSKRIEPQPHEGRRIMKVEDGWLILNGSKFRKLIGEAKRKGYKAMKQREYRLIASGVDRDVAKEIAQRGPATEWGDGFEFKEGAEERPRI